MLGFYVRVHVGEKEEVLFLCHEKVEMCAWALGLRICADGDQCKDWRIWSAGHSHVPPEYLEPETLKRLSLRPEAKQFLEKVIQANRENGLVIYYRPAPILQL